MKGRKITYTQRELRWVKANSQRKRVEAHGEFVQKFTRPDVKLSNFNSLCKRMGWLTGRTGRYEKGRTPENKGKKMPYNANSARTQFKKGNTPHNARYLGHERVTADGYVEISVAQKNPHTGFERTYVLKHLHLWEAKHGPLPQGMCLKCKDSNRQNTAPHNWEAIPRALLPRLNGGRMGTLVKYDEAEPELKPVLMSAAKLAHAIRHVGQDQ